MFETVKGVRGEASDKSARGLSIERAGPRRSERSARAQLWAALFVGAALCIAYFVARRSDLESAAKPEARPAPDSRAPAATDSSPLASADESPLSIGRRSPANAAALDAADPARFSGVGRLRGVLTTDPAHIPLPERWKLRLRPSGSLIGGDRVASREIDVGSDGHFAIDDLPLGGYELSIDAGDLDSPIRHVLLAKPDTQDVYLTLVARPAGSIDGRVVDDAGVGVAGLEMFLVNGEERLETTTIAGGAYRFERVHDATYRVIAANPEHPLIAPSEVLFSGPHATVPEIRLPKLGSASFETLDAKGVALSDVEIVGIGANGGVFRVKSDAQGRAEARFVVPGEYSVTATHALLGRRKTSIQVVLDEPASVRIAFRP